MTDIQQQGLNEQERVDQYRQRSGCEEPHSIRFAHRKREVYVKGIEEESTTDLCQTKVKCPLTRVELRSGNGETPSLNNIVRLKIKGRMIEPEEESIFRQNVSESDIDWLFCVELNVSPAFRIWVAAHLFPELKDFDHVLAWRSISNVVGESDLLWLIDTPDKGRMMGLIENKINAPAQAGQYLRYVSRGEGYLADGTCQEFSIAHSRPEDTVQPILMRIPSKFLTRTLKRGSVEERIAGLNIWELCSKVPKLMRHLRCL